jgi:sensor histidine kinase YesM
MIALEIIEDCNYRCRYCLPNGVEKKKIMDASLATRIMTEASQLGITSIDLTPQRGEFFLHPNAYELLSCACDLFDTVELFTNLSVIDVEQLTAIQLQKLHLHVSHYGSDPDTFIYFTNTSETMFNTYQMHLSQLQAAGIKVLVEDRSSDKFYTHTDTTVVSGKCIYHYTPTILADGRTMCCCNINNNGIDSDLSFDTIHNKSLRAVLESPARYKFYEEQEFCKTSCGYFKNSNTEKSPPFASLKLLQASKRNNNANI